MNKRPTKYGKKDNKNQFYKNKNRGRGGRNNKTINKGSSLDNVFKRYDNLIEQYLEGRKKYFEMYARVAEGHRRKLENHFYQSVKNIRQFERQLSHWQKAKLTARDFLGKLVTDFEEKHQEEKPEIKELEPHELRDPHFTMEQELASASLKNDTEESQGTMEDYKQYKGEV